MKSKKNKIVIERLDAKSIEWHGVENVARVEDAAWFPLQDVMGVVDKKYRDTKGLGVKIVGTLGSRCVGVASKTLSAFIEALEAKGHTVSVA